MMAKERTHVITGHREEVYAALSRAVEENRLVSVTGTRLLPQERVQLVARLREPAVPRRPAKAWLVIAAKTLGVLVVLGAVGGLVWLLVQAVLALIALVAAVIAWVQAHLLVIGLVVVALLFLVFGGGGGCGGIHCGGCRG